LILRPGGTVGLLGAIILFSSGLCAQEGYLITDVEFTGNKAFGSGELMEQLQFQPSGWIGRTFGGAEPAFFSNENMDEDAESLRRFLQKGGFIDAAVAWSVSSVDDDDREVELLYAIDEGAPVLVGAVGFSLHRPNSLAQSVTDSLVHLETDEYRLKRGATFRDEDLRADHSHLLRILNNSGLPYSTVEHTLALRPGLDSIDVLWNIDTGPLSYFGGYTVDGNDLYNDQLIHDRVLFHEGEIYDQSLMEETQQDIYDLGLYRVVSIKALLGDTTGHAIPIGVHLEETPRYRFRTGVGYGRDEKFRVSARVDILGIFGTAGQVGLELKRSELEPFTVLVTYLHPDFIVPKMRFTVRPFLRREDEPGYEARRRGYDVGVARSLLFDLFASLSFAYEQTDIYRTPNVPLPPNYRDSYPKEAINFSLGYSSATPLFSPAGGFSAALTTSFSGLNLIKSDEYEFTRVILDLRYYLGLTASAVVATRLKLGSIRSRDNPEFIPFEERFYSGGSVSVRGWPRSGLGPLDPEGRPLGGGSLFETGVELRVPQESTLYGVLFLEAGNVWETAGTYKLNDLGYSAGAGIRYATPIGPLRFDVAHPLFIGSRQVQWWFSIGHAF